MIPLPCTVFFLAICRLCTTMLLIYESYFGCKKPFCSGLGWCLCQIDAFWNAWFIHGFDEEWCYHAAFVYVISHTTVAWWRRWWWSQFKLSSCYIVHNFFYTGHCKTITATIPGSRSIFDCTIAIATFFGGRSDVHRGAVHTSLAFGFRAEDFRSMWNLRRS